MNCERFGPLWEKRVINARYYYYMLGIIAAVAETWLTDSSKNNHTLASIRSTLPNFTFQHLTRIGVTGGGLGLLAHKGFNVTLNCNRFFLLPWNTWIARCLVYQVMRCG